MGLSFNLIRQMLEGKSLEREVGKASRRESKQCVGVSGCGSLGNPGLTDGNNPQLMASETTGRVEIRDQGASLKKSLRGKNDQECMSKLDGYFMK